ncbi:MAG: hypothetical protein REI09_11275 [Candidatus Dactylopiibacterium sp.]|nr:hypothetical protein [Candidatus Dactylopiibacterium sp.]
MNRKPHLNRESDTRHREDMEREREAYISELRVESTQFGQDREPLEAEVELREPD